MAEEKKLKDKDVKHVDLDITYPIDYASVVKNLGGDPKLFFMML